MTDYREQLKQIRTFPSLVKFLRDELDWPVETEDFEELTFEYEPEELGIDAANAAKIDEIKRLRPLVANQPWGIFFVKFEPKQLPVVALRRILAGVVVKKRATASAAEQPKWAEDDLLFISNYGEGDERKISFAHFSKDPAKNDLPTLKVIAWDELDTPLHLDHTANLLVERLSWPSSETEWDDETWRERWRSAFELKHREVITTSKVLAERLAELARLIRAEILRVLGIETDDGKVSQLMKAFQEALVHDLDADGFADMYAQTIAYGLLSARIADPTANTADDLALHMQTNPFLRELMETFLHVGGRGQAAQGASVGIDFDELGVGEVVQLLDDAKMEAVVLDFGDNNPLEDPVIHFYELFLKEYDAKKRMQRGVFYTPKPVVSYIVRSVDGLLRSEFGLADGLADTTSWGEMATRHPGLVLPDGVSEEECFVQILDPATGTGTFLVEVIDVVHRTMFGRWRAEGHGLEKLEELWNDYVPEFLLPRLHAYELMMAPYAIAHVKVGLKLYETGYRFGSESRLRIYLTNALEPPEDFTDRLDFAVPALAHEAHAVNAVKEHARFTVVVGNPPYSGHSWNLTPPLRRLVEEYRYVDGERIREKGALQLEKSIQDDYVKFVRLAELHIQKSKLGVVGLVTSHGYLDNPFLRGMRSSVRSTFSRLFVLDLHGNGLRYEKAPDGSPDQNVFDIKRTGVAISLFRRVWPTLPAEVVSHADIWGDRDLVKYPRLASETISTTPSSTLSPRPPAYLFIPQNSPHSEEYERGYSLAEVMPVHSKGCVTGRDAFVIDFEKESLLGRMAAFVDTASSDEELIERYKLNPSDWWDVTKARKAMPALADLPKFVRPILYRPFDTRHCFYHPAVFMSPRRPVMSHVDNNRENMILITSRMTKGEQFQHVTVTRGLAEAILLSSKTSNNAIVFPLYLYPDTENGERLPLSEARRPNFTDDFVRAIGDGLRVSVVDGRGDLQASVGFDDVFDYVVAILHSPAYRERYAAPLTREFPRIPLTANIDLFARLSALGGKLVALHLLEAAAADAEQFTAYIGPKHPEVKRVGWTDETVWLDAPATNKDEPASAGSVGFPGVPATVWDFHVGGYRVCEKWLKDRKGRTLSPDDVQHYQQIIWTISEIIRLMREIDVVIDGEGGWPSAFTASA